MRKFYFLVILITFYFSQFNNLLAQEFDTLIVSDNSFSYGDIRWADFDNDNDYDIIYTGSGNTSIFKNDNSTDFILIDANLPPLSYSSLDIKDIDKDGYVDICLNGMDSLGNSIIQIFINKGNFEFEKYLSEQAGLRKGFCRLSDMDNDFDYDIIATGLDIHGSPQLVIYENVNNEMLLLKDVNIIPVYKGPTESACLECRDVNNDNLKDIILSGYDWSQNYYAKIYLNNGNFNYSSFDPGFPVLSKGIITCGDLDNDSDIDIAFSGDYIWDDSRNVILENNNSGYISHVDIVNPWGLNLDFCDFNNNGYFDILYSGPLNVGHPSTISYNQKNLTFVDSLINIPKSMYVDIGDFDFDKDNDFLCGGYEGIFIGINNCNVVNQPPSVPLKLTSEVVGTIATLNWNSSIDDKTNIKGITYNLKLGEFKDSFNIINSEIPRLSIEGNLLNDTTITFNDLSPGKYFWTVQAVDKTFNCSNYAETDSIIIPEVYESVEITLPEITFTADYDNDNDLDLLSANYILINSNNNFDSIPNNLGGYWIDYNNDNMFDLFCEGKLYEYMNDTIYLVYDFGLYGGDSWADYNNDGLIDFAVTSHNYDLYETKIFKNLGNGDFKEVNCEITGVRDGDIEWLDIDGDYDFDIVVSGKDQYMGNEGITKIYLNNNNNFETLNNDLDKIFYSNICCLDANNDRQIDLIIGGQALNAAFCSYFINDNESYINSNSFIRANRNPVISAGDYNNDGNTDFLINNKLYVNNSYSFSESSLLIPNSGITFFDYDNDHDLDILTKTTIIQNNGNWPNDPPAAPSGLRIERNGFGILFGWNEATDPQSTEGGLSYNLRVGTTPGGVDIVSPMSDVATGYRRIPKMGNCQMNLGWRLDTLPEGTYYWSVQAIDQSFMGGAWSEEQTFTITVIRADFEADTVCLGDTTHFTDLSLTGGTDITAWEWSFGDDSTSTGQHPNHVYQAAGNYEVTLVALGGDFSDTLTQMVVVKPKPETGFTTSIVCQGTATPFTNTTQTNGLTINTWQWDFGDGSSSALENPTEHGYLSAGDYPVKLKAGADNGCSDSIEQNVIVSAYPLPSISAAGAATFCQGDSVSLSATNNVNYTYQWKRDNVNITGEDSSIFKAQETGIYHVAITNTTGNCLTNSDEVQVTAVAKPNAPTITISGATTFCQGDSVTLSVTNNTDYTYQWKLNGGAVGGDSHEHVVNTSGTYSLEVSNANGCSTTSANTVTVTVNANPSVPSLSVTGLPEFCQGGSATLSVPNNENYIYQWLNNSSTIESATSNSYQVTSTGNYFLKVSNTEGCEVQSNTESITVNASPGSPTITTSGATSFCQGDSVTLSVTNNTDYTYQWKLNGGAVGADSHNLKVTTPGIYTVEVLNAQGCSTTSANEIEVSIIPSPVVPTVNINGSTEFCRGDSVVLSVKESPDYTYLWIKDGYALGEEGISLTVKEAGSYKLNVLNTTGCSAETAPVNIGVKEAPPQPTIAYNSALEFCQGDSVMLSFDQVEGCSSVWLVNGEPQQSDEYSYVARQSGTYQVQLEYINGCTSNSINNIDITVYPTPVVRSISLDGPPTFCEGKSVTLSVTTETAESYQWFNENGSITGAQTASYVANQSGNYGVEITNSHACSYKTNTIEVISAATPPEQEIIVEGATDICPGQEVSLKVQESEQYSYQWKLDGVNIDNEQGYGILAGKEGKYSVEISNYECKIVTQPVEVTHKPSLPKPQIIAEGPNVWVLACDMEAELYKWYFNGELLPEATEQVYVANQDLGEYYITVNDGGECHVASDIIAIPLNSTGVTEMESIFGTIKIYPNPTPGLFTIEMDNQIIGRLYIRIINEQGKELFNIKHDKNTIHMKTEMDLSGQGDGIYFIQFRFEEAVEVRKVVVE